MSETPSPRLTAAELWDQQNEEADERVSKLADTVTQREWLQITTALERTRNQIGADSGLTLCVLAWVKEKRDHGGASWDRLLDMTDAQLGEFHGYPAQPRPEDGPPPAEPAEPAEPAAPTAGQIADAL